MLRQIVLAVVLCFFANVYASDSLSCEGKLDGKGEKHGIWACRVNGRLVKREQYKHGVLKGYIIFNAKGEAVETRNRKGKVKKYTPCGC